MGSRQTTSRRAGRPRFQVEALEGRQLLTVNFTTEFYSASAPVGPATITLNHFNGTTTATSPENVDISLGGGTAVPGVDYTPGDQVVSVGPNETSKTVTIPLLPGNPSEGTRILQLNISPSAGSPPTDRAFLVITHNADTTPPAVIASKALTKGRNITGFVLTFNKDMAPGPVQDVNNYVVIDPRPAHLRRPQFVTSTPTLPLKSAVYDPSTHSVTLTPLGKVRKYYAFSIMDRNSMAQGPSFGGPGNLLFQTVPLAQISPITDTTGNPLGWGMPFGPSGAPQYSGILNATVSVTRLAKKLAGVA